PFFWDRPGRLRVGNVLWETGLDLSRSHRWTVDYLEDYLLVRRVFEALYVDQTEFTLEDILDLLDRNQDLRDVKGQYRGVNWYRHHLSRLRTVSSSDTRDPAVVTGRS